MLQYCMRIELFSFVHYSSNTTCDGSPYKIEESAANEVISKVCKCRDLTTY